MTRKMLLSSSNALQRKRSKKAELAGQTFLYIMGIVIVAAILIYGIRAMFKLSDQADSVKIIEFRQNLENKLQQSMHTDNHLFEDITVPGGFTKICFVNIGKGAPPGCNSLLDPVVCEGWDNNVKNNVFLIEKTASEFLSIRDYKGGNAIATEAANTNNFVCYTISNGRFKINGLGKGSQIEIRP